MKMTTTLTRQIGNPLSTGRQMNDIPAELDSHPSDGELQLLVLEIKAGMARQSLPEIQANPKLLSQSKAVTRKQIDKLLKKIPVSINQHKQHLIKKWSGIDNIESIVAEAVNITLMEAVTKIEKYDPEKYPNVTIWIQTILKSRFLDLLRKYRPRYESISLDNPDAMAEAEVAFSSEPEPESIASKLRNFVESDPENHLSKHIRDNPTATFQAILIMRLNDLTWQQIADSLNIASHATVNNFHDKQLAKWKHYFRNHLSKYRREQSIS
jgi:DNA-directed RNA polymerase specialized sigma24 family protein